MTAQGERSRARRRQRRQQVHDQQAAHPPPMHWAHLCSRPGLVEVAEDFSIEEALLSASTYVGKRDHSGLDAVQVLTLDDARAEGARVVPWDGRRVVR